MGKKRRKKREHIFLHSACLLTILLLSFGCATTSNFQKKLQGRKHLDQAEQLITKGDYTGALKEDGEAAGLLSGASRDSALFHMGLIWAHPDNPQKDYQKALEYFQQIVHDFPDSTLADESRVAEGAINEILARESIIKKREETLTDLKKELGSLKDIEARVEVKNKDLEEKNKDLEETVRALKRQINALKEIDMGIEEKKREDSPGKTNR
jgi:tetratricopeptide (TPR) repeat protein